MKKFIFIITFICSLTSCKKTENTIEKDILSKTFFDFDNVEYYKLNLTNKDVINLSSSLLEGEELSKKDSINEKIYMFVTNVNPKTLEENEINIILSAVKNKKTTIDNKYFKTIKSDIFIEKKV